MLFDTPVYYVFLVLVVISYWRLNTRSQNQLLLAASYLFYGWWDWRFLSLMAGSTLVDYLLAARIAGSSDLRARRAYLAISLVMNFAFLGVFKYFNFFIDSFATVSAALGYVDRPLPLLQIVLPAGISFYTFQTVAYIVDVYYGEVKPARSLVDYALFISLFPHLVAGPIQRPSHLLPQVEAHRRFDEVAFFDGLMLIATGLFRKCVIADNCALIANAVFDGALGEWTATTVLLGVYAFAWQIYGDFSGYSDIARGSAQLLGFHFMVNLRQPYLATSLSDFWGRWHISLSTWLRDYLYIPLGGNRRGCIRTYVNLLTTMLLGGLWHGANWTYVIWGGIHGLGLVLQRVVGWERRESVAQQGAASSLGTIWLKRFIVFHFVCIAWLFFRADSVSSAWGMLEGLCVWNPDQRVFGALPFLAAFTVPLFLLDLRMERCHEEYPLQRLTTFDPNTSYGLRIALAMSLLGGVLIFGAVSSNAFIYFQF